MSHLLQILLPGTSLTHKEISLFPLHPPSPPGRKVPPKPRLDVWSIEKQTPRYRREVSVTYLCGGSPGRGRDPGDSGKFGAGSAGGREGFSLRARHLPLPEEGVSLPAARPRGDGGWRAPSWAGCRTPGPPPSPALPTPTQGAASPHTPALPLPPVPQGRSVRLASLPGAGTARGWAAPLAPGGGG